MRACVCVRACVRACVCVCVCSDCPVIGGTADAEIMIPLLQTQGWQIFSFLSLSFKPGIGLDHRFASFAKGGKKGGGGAAGGGVGVGVGMGGNVGAAEGGGGGE